MKNVYPFNENAYSKDITKSDIYLIREKLNNKIKLSRDEKNYITKKCFDNSFFKYGLEN